jgi:hypothetical protein
MDKPKTLYVMVTLTGQSVLKSESSCYSDNDPIKDNNWSQAA